MNRSLSLTGKDILFHEAVNQRKRFVLCTTHDQATGRLLLLHSQIFSIGEIGEQASRRARQTLLLLRTQLSSTRPQSRNAYRQGEFAFVLTHDGHHSAVLVRDKLSQTRGCLNPFWVSCCRRDRQHASLA